MGGELKRFHEAYVRHYFRIMPMMMRGFAIVGLTMCTIAAIAQLLSGEPFTVNWAMTYGVALLLFGAILLASGRVQQMGPRSN